MEDFVFEREFSLGVKALDENICFFSPKRRTYSKAEWALRA